MQAAGTECRCLSSTAHSLATHRNMAESWSQGSLTSREKCWPSVLSLAVNFLLTSSFTLDGICIRKLKSSSGSCLNHLKKLKALSLQLQFSVKLLAFWTVREGRLGSTTAVCSGGVKRFSYVRKNFFKEIFLSHFIFLRINSRLSPGSL